MVLNTLSFTFKTQSQYLQMLKKRLISKECIVLAAFAVKTHLKYKMKSRVTTEVVNNLIITNMKLQKLLQLLQK